MVRRRDFLGAIAAALASESAGDAGGVSGWRDGGSSIQPPQRMVMRFLGMNGFREDGGKVDVLCLNPKDISVPGAGGEKFHAHVPILVIPTDSLVDPGAGNEVTPGDLELWRLRTDVTRLRKFEGFTEIQVSNLNPTVGVEVGVRGWVPLVRMVDRRALTNPADKKIVAARMSIVSGMLSDDHPRNLVVGTVIKTNVANAYWWLTTGTWGSRDDVPQKLTDVLKWENDATAAIEFRLTTTTGITVVRTKGDRIEPYLINSPTMKMTGSETKRPYELWHIWAAYEVFDEPEDPSNRRIPKTDPQYFATGDPVYCPPFGL